MDIFRRHIKLILTTCTILISNVVAAQQAVHNFGNLQFHESVSVGFHLNLIDDGVFDQNTGLTGFYGLNPLTIAGSSHPIFEDMEVVAENGLFLETWVGVTNNLNFIIGDIVTEKNTSSSYLNFMGSAFYTGTGDATHIDGYAATSGKDLITFPVGEGSKIRPLTITSNGINDLARCAYYFENPDNPSTLTEQFNTSVTDFDDLKVSEVEFWLLDSNQPSVIELSWDVDSAADQLAVSIENLLVVGWSKSENQWERLGNSSISGNLQAGRITSDTFIPSDYEIITLGGTDDLLEPFTVLELDNYFLTPNNDGVNDFLLIDGIENVPNNLLNIYNRYGVLVYSKLNYANGFDGKSNRNSVISRGSGLSSGIYFYVLTVNDTREKFQGYLYISD